MASTYCYNRSMPSGRQVGLCSTSNLANLSGTCRCILAAEAPDPVEYNKDGMPTLDIYTSGATVYGSYVLLFPSFFHHFPSYQNASAGPWPGMDHDGLLDVRFMFMDMSKRGEPDLPEYVDALNGRSPFISLGINRCHILGSESQHGGWCNPNSTDLQRTSPRTGMSYFSPGLLLDARREQISLFSGAMPYTHGSGGLMSAGLNNTAIERWKLRVDGFGSIQGEYVFSPAAEVPTVTTRPLTLPRCPSPSSLELQVNTITSVVGYVRIGLAPADAGGEDGAFGPYSLGASNAIKGNFIRRAASWGRPGTAGYLQSLNALGGRRVVATVLMPDARLFSLTATCAAGAREAAAPSVAAPAASKNDDDGKPLTIMTVLIDDVGAALSCHTLHQPPTRPTPPRPLILRRRLGRHRDPQPLLPDSSHRPAGVRGR